MSDEIKVTNEIENKPEHKCICQSEFFRKFLVIALGTFVGFYCALSLFAALHKPPMMHHQGFGGPAPIVAPCPCGCMHRHHFKGGEVKFDKKIKHGEHRQAPFDAQRNFQPEDKD